MITQRLDLALPGGVEARVVFTGRGQPVAGGPTPSPYAWANLASHVGDEDGAVIAARTALAGALGVAPGAMTFMHPDHGRGVAVIGSPTGVQPGAEIRDVDALVTARPGVGLVALSADCVPIVVVHSRAGVVAAVHCGWRGLVVDVLGAALDEVRTVAGDLRGAVALLGPAICGSCYPVAAQRAEEVAQVRPEAVTRAADGQPAIDLRAGLRARLAQAGVTARVVGGCTAEDPGLYSHRRDRVTGRQAGAVSIVAAS